MITFPTITYPDGSSYHGELSAQGIPNGWGIAVWKNPHRTYTGFWLNGKMHGIGKYSTDNLSIKCEFENSIPKIANVVEKDGIFIGEISIPEKPLYFQPVKIDGPGLKTHSIVAPQLFPQDDPMEIGDLSPQISQNSLKRKFTEESEATTNSKFPRTEESSNAALDFSHLNTLVEPLSPGIEYEKPSSEVPIASPTCNKENDDILEELESKTADIETLEKVSKTDEDILRKILDYNKAHDNKLWELPSKKANKKIKCGRDRLATVFKRCTGSDWPYTKMQVYKNLSKILDPLPKEYRKLPHQSRVWHASLNHATLLAGISNSAVLQRHWTAMCAEPWSTTLKQINAVSKNEEALSQLDKSYEDKVKLFLNKIDFETIIKKTLGIHADTEDIERTSAIESSPLIENQIKVPTKKINKTFIRDRLIKLFCEKNTLNNYTNTNLQFNVYQTYLWHLSNEDMCKLFLQETGSPCYSTKVYEVWRNFFGEPWPYQTLKNMNDDERCALDSRILKKIAEYNNTKS